MLSQSGHTMEHLSFFFISKASHVGTSIDNGGWKGPILPYCNNGQHGIAYRLCILTWIKFIFASLALGMMWIFSLPAINSISLGVNEAWWARGKAMVRYECKERKRVSPKAGLSI